jgi:hypothetical protein
MVWWPFATKPERVDTSEVTDLHSGAPPLYSTSFVVSLFVPSAPSSFRFKWFKPFNRCAPFKRFERLERFERP